MAKHIVGELFAVAHIRKYLERNLHPDTAHTTQHGVVLQRRIAEKIIYGVQLNLEPDPTPGGPRGRLSLVAKAPEQGDIPKFIHDEIMREVEQLFWQELRSTVRQLTPFTHKKRSAIENFLQQYGITEEEMPIQTVLRLYHRQVRRDEVKVGVKRGRGRPRKHKPGTRLR